jgi:hypothetical protein
MHGPAADVRLAHLNFAELSTHHRPQRLHPDAQLDTNDRLPSNTQSHIMDTAKAPVKLVKVTRVLGRTGTRISTIS